MPVLKQQRSTPLIRDAVVLDLGDLGRQAEVLKAAAQQRAQRILQEAREEAKRITEGAAETGRAEGHAQGLEQGLAEGREQGRAQALAEGQSQVEQVTQTMAAVASDWQQHRAAIEAEARAGVLRFALKFAEKLTHRVIEVHPEVVVDQVAAALRQVLEPTDVVIHTHPEDRPILEEVLPGMLQNLSQIHHVSCYEDEAVGRGGCVLGLQGGEIDATLDTQIRRIVELVAPETLEPADPPFEEADVVGEASDPAQPVGSADAADAAAPGPPDPPPAPPRSDPPPSPDAGD